MKKISFDIFDELDFHRIADELKNKRIPYEYKFYQSSILPSIDMNPPFAAIIVQEMYKDTVEAILQEDTDEEFMTEIPVETSQNSSQRKLLNYNWQVILLLYAIVATIAAIRGQVILNKNGARKNFKVAWSADGTTVFEIHQDGLYKTAYFDFNWDANYEKVRLIYDDKVIYEGLDQNEDGLVEFVKTYDLNGNETGRTFDKDKDGLVDVHYFYLENQDTLILKDINADGAFELVK